MKYLYLILGSILFPSLALANKPQDSGDRVIATTVMVFIVAAIAALLRAFKK